MVEKELGVWAAEWYIGACISSFLAAVKLVYQSKPDTHKSQYDSLSEIFGTISRIPRRDQTTPKANDISAKATTLIEMLCTEMETTSTGMVFMNGPATVVALGGLLTAHFGNDSRFRIGTFLTQIRALRPSVRTTGYIQRWEQIYEDFKSGKVNLLIGTGLMQHYVSISTCQMVVYLDPAMDIKSFLQRRSGTQKQPSKHIMIVSEDGSGTTPHLEDEDKPVEAMETLCPNSLPVPLTTDTEDGPDNHPSGGFAKSVEVAPLLDPWKIQVWHRTSITISSELHQTVTMIMFHPQPTTAPPDFELFYDKQIRYQVRSTPLGRVALSREEVQSLQQITFVLLSSVYSDRLEAGKDDFLTLFMPQKQNSNFDLAAWAKAVEGVRPAAEVLSASGYTNASELGLVQPSGQLSNPFAFRLFLLDPNTSTTASELDPKQLPKLCIQATKIHRRGDFSLPISDVEKDAKSKYTPEHTLWAETCTIDNLPLPYVIFALFVPLILHRFEMFMLADNLRSTVLAPLQLSNRNSVLTAITAKSTQGADYQRLEYLGDSVLRLCTSVELMAAPPSGVMGGLTNARSRIDSNESLVRACQRVGIDRYIITEAFAGLEWRPRYTSEMNGSQSSPQEPRKLRFKILADVVEALIGVSFVDGGISKALQCIQLFHPNEKWHHLPYSQCALYTAAPTLKSAPDVEQLETLISYNFNKKALLLQAVKSSAVEGFKSATSYRRLQFLGDAVLEYIICLKLFHNPQLPQSTIGAIRSACANANLLAFLCIDSSIRKQRFDAPTATTVASTGDSAPTLTSPKIPTIIWHFLHSASTNSTFSHAATLHRYHALREEIAEALVHASEYPWRQLAALAPSNDFSDLVQSILGAIFIDSAGHNGLVDSADSGGFFGGSDLWLQGCETFLERLGVLPVLRRISNEGVDCLHPKERLPMLGLNRQIYSGGWIGREGAGVVEGGAEGDAAKDGSEKETQGKVWRCSVRVRGRVVVVDGVTKAAAEAEAAWRACRILSRKRVAGRAPGNGKGPALHRLQAPLPASEALTRPTQQGLRVHRCPSRKAKLTPRGARARELSTPIRPELRPRAAELRTLLRRGRATRPMERARPTEKHIISGKNSRQTLHKATVELYLQLERYLLLTTKWTQRYAAEKHLCGNGCKPSNYAT
ncbi:Dicer-like protein 2 [Coniosporium tulheliwenetii]|uniref:Dicer-like protein 2 n=1 Tax=Coniosporium tulheliwenetii TaxID=3383036 RepID=A0ACC2ZP35_9PEZI|nr:Dicer-like protein 2 [Cladosporium sp. JES 115]